MTHDEMLALGAKPPRNLGRAEVEAMGIPEFDARRRRILCAEPGCLNRVLTAGPYPVFCPEHEKCPVHEALWYLDGCDYTCPTPDCRYKRGASA